MRYTMDNLRATLKSTFPEIYALENGPELNEELRQIKQLSKGTDADKKIAEIMSESIFHRFEALELQKNSLTNIYTLHKEKIATNLTTITNWRGIGPELLVTALEKVRGSILQLKELNRNLSNLSEETFVPPEFPENLGLPYEVKFHTSQSPISMDAPSPTLELEALSDPKTITEEDYALSFPEFCTVVLPRFFTNEVLEKGFKDPLFKQLTLLQSSWTLREEFVAKLEELSTT